MSHVSKDSDHVLYISYLKRCFVAFCGDFWMKFCQSWPFSTKMRADIRSVHPKKLLNSFVSGDISSNFEQKYFLDISALSIM